MTKQEAVAEQIDQAIRLCEKDLYASSVTLAGAAEGAMPKPGDDTLFVFLQRLGVEVLQIDATRVANEHLNAARNWLKHPKPNTPMGITAADAFIMVLRAYTKFVQVYGEEAATDTMRWFMDEFREALTKILAPLLLIGIVAAGHITRQEGRSATGA